MSVVTQMILLAVLMIGGVSALGGLIAFWAHKQNERNNPHRQYRKSVP